MPTKELSCLNWRISVVKLIGCPSHTSMCGFSSWRWIPGVCTPMRCIVSTFITWYMPEHSMPKPRLEHAELTKMGSGGPSPRKTCVCPETSTESLRMLPSPWHSSASTSSGEMDAWRSAIETSSFCCGPLGAQRRADAPPWFIEIAPRFAITGLPSSWISSPSTTSAHLSETMEPEPSPLHQPAAETSYVKALPPGFMKPAAQARR
mmetsp:Transcript_24516/g.68894  ORF Transcript_24516/g.68894 Transcript_24516/m.68894 type:complete len:206 (+) Transcript_24516:946-1563(+)